jgi:hypothetical protein
MVAILENQKIGGNLIAAVGILLASDFLFSI